MKTDQSLHQQALMFEGKDHWHLNTDKDVTFSDGPNGLRIEDEDGIGFNHSKEATVFPTEACVGCSFDRDLLEEFGRLLAEECICEKVDVVLGPGVNIKRSPLCGRNFEYFSEDPVLSGEYAAAYIQGVQSKGIGTSLKHFAANSRELGRQVADSIMDERTLQEIYLRQFEIAVKKGHPWTLMAAYNQLNGVHCCENEELFKEARGWGFDGMILSDWGGVADPIRSIANGLNLEMPGPSGSSALIEKAVKEGRLPRTVLQQSSDYMNAFVEKCGHYTSAEYDQNKHDEFCERAAEESIVLLKNNHILPLKKTEKTAVIGPLAMHPCIQGTGSSKVNAIDQDSLLQALDKEKIPYAYAQGFSMDSENIDQEMQKEALAISEGCSHVIVMVGEQEKRGGEGFDRSSMDLAVNQDTLIRALIHAGRKVIAIVQTGSPVTLPWRSEAQAIVAEYAAGARSGAALKSILYGDADPSGHLAETWPLRSEDIPSSRYYSSDVLQCQYREAIFTGYRYYDTFSVPTAYPFGYGLSYTEFAYSDLQISHEKDSVHVSVKVKNTGSREGRTAVQLYVGMKDSRIARAAKELKDFASVALQAGEEKEVQFDLGFSAFDYYDVRQHQFQTEQGTYQIMIGKSVQDIVLQGEIEMEGVQDPYSTIKKTMIQHDAGMVYVSDEAFACMLEHQIPTRRSPRPFTPDTTIRELKACGLGKFINAAAKKILTMDVMHGVDDASVFNAPIRQMLWLKEYYTWDTVYAAADYLNHHGLKEWNRLLKTLKKRSVKEP
ncbi:MAG: glycoside hydrolase family 3 C-terminal domain-containing protein [Solobacterium sp.]|jgi:beta-glucosidase|nr:glycoside hydrolase family 3 C-terminal domain-containing protein [Solobacterium sp.]MCH4205142.1 glycoside hydrolase family 3 C-terminal domain-containing protein [Solobacterium sp.]MCH4226735.1 glycoside hydrolase family 3 C-terminal domain-containing protein [Solobacterium sp.]MCH4281936.1 glycoside hydrolase family 3 C-terminal domain-containing protein [Solobacterium sp.]